MFRKYAHILKRNKAVERPRHLIFFDTETSEVKGKKETELIFKLGSCVHYKVDRKEENWKDFKTIQDFWDWIFSRIHSKETFYLIAHNLPFDFRILKGFAEMNNRRMKQDRIIFEGTTNIFSFSHGSKRLVFIDDMNFFKSSLEILGKNVGINKMDILKDDLQEYCRNDVLIMLEAWKKYLKFLDDNDLGNFALTIAGQAFNAFRHKFMNQEIYIHNNESSISDERNAYHGGRTECFKIGKFPKKKYRMYDVNSMYPSVMKRFDYPVKYEYKITTPSIIKMARLILSKCVIARCLVETDEPVFPYKDEDTGKLIFPVGKFYTFLTTREIEYALDNNLIEKIDFARVYQAENIFEKYVDFFYAKKKEYKENGDESFGYICKLFLNSLYGKFGQRNKFYKPSKEKFDHDGQYYDVNTDQDFRVINGRTEVFAGWREGIDSFVAIPAHITADARMELWMIIKELGRKNVFYCDTDSVITNKRIKTSKELGELSLKCESDKLEIRGNKDYTFAGETVIKGIRKNARKITESSFEQVQFEGMAGSISKNRIDQVFIWDIIKTLKRDYDKGKVLSNGTVVPFKIDVMI